MKRAPTILHNPKPHHVTQDVRHVNTQHRQRWSKENASAQANSTLSRTSALTPLASKQRSTSTFAFFTALCTTVRPLYQHQTQTQSHRRKPRHNRQRIRSTQSSTLVLYDTNLRQSLHIRATLDQRRHNIHVRGVLCSHMQWCESFLQETQRLNVTHHSYNRFNINRRQQNVPSKMHSHRHHHPRDTAQLQHRN